MGRLLPVQEFPAKGTTKNNGAASTRAWPAAGLDEAVVALRKGNK